MRRIATLSAVILVAPALARAAPDPPGRYEWRLAGGTVRVAADPLQTGASMTVTTAPPAPEWFGAEAAARERPGQASPRRPESALGRRYLVLAAVSSLGPGDRERLAAAGA